MKSLRRVSILLGWAKFIVLLIAVSTLVYASSSSNLLTHLRYLASDKLKGRGNGSAELDQAARYIAGQFEKYGLKVPVTRLRVLVVILVGKFFNLMLVIFLYKLVELDSMG